MIKLKSNSNQLIKKYIYDDGVRAYYYSVCERYANGYVQTFITDMQTLITKLGVMMSKISINGKDISSPVAVFG